jgi:hypothetical protein
VLCGSNRGATRGQCGWNGARRVGGRGSPLRVSGRGVSPRLHTWRRLEGRARELQSLDRAPFAACCHAESGRQGGCAANYLIRAPVSTPLYRGAVSLKWSQTIASIGAITADATLPARLNPNRGLDPVRHHRSRCD